MYRFVLVLTLIFFVNFTFARKMATASDTLPQSTTMIAPHEDSIQQADSTKAASEVVPQQEAKTSKSEKEEVDKDSLGYKIGYNIGQWLIPGILMLLATIMFIRLSKKNKERQDWD
ncbi:MAG: hypothetical protein NXI10_08120 [bacterium]|nr:hypothetical protein [bacterium]